MTKRLAKSSERIKPFALEVFQIQRSNANVQIINEETALWRRDPDVSSKRGNNVRCFRGRRNSNGSDSAPENCETCVWRPTSPNTNIAFFVLLRGPSLVTWSLTRSTRSRASCSRSFIAREFMTSYEISWIAPYRRSLCTSDLRFIRAGLQSHSTFVKMASLLFDLETWVITILLTSLKYRLNGKCHGVCLSVIT